MNKTSKNIASRNENDLTPQKKKRVVIILLSIYLFFSLLYIFYSQKMSTFLSICVIIPPLLLSFVLAIFLFKKDTSTKVRKILFIFKLSLTVTILIVFTLGGQGQYKKFHLNNYRKLTPGIVTKISGDYYGKSGNWTYYTEYSFRINNTIKEGYSTSSYKTYKEGDSVMIAYSYKDPDFYEIDGNEN